MSNDPKKTALGWIPQSPGQPWNGQPVARLAQPQYPQPQQPYAPPHPHVIQSPYAQPPQMPAPPRAARPSPPPYAPQQPAARPSPLRYAQQPHAQQPAARPSPPPYAQQPQPAYPQQPYAQQPQQPYAQQPAYPQPFAPSPQPSYGAQPQQPAYPQHPAPQQPAYAAQAQQPYAQPAPQPYAAAPAPFAPFAPSQQAAGREAIAAQNHAASYLKARSAEGSKSKPRPISGADATVGVSQRVRFIRQTYLHLLGAILTFAGLLYLLMTNDFLVAKVSIPLVKFAIGGRWNWGVVLAAFMAVSYVADHWATHATSRGMQYAGLGFYVLAEALIFVPLLAIVEWKTQQILARGGAEPHIIRDSAFVTIGVFTALTASVFVSKKDFSFLRSGLVMASGAALTLIFMALTFGFNLGLVFSGAMVLLAAGYILYQTSQVLAHYDPHQHVAAALGLFSSVALMFWYVIRIFMRARE